MSKAEDLNDIYASYQSTVLNEGQYQNPYQAELLTEEDYDHRDMGEYRPGEGSDTISDEVRGLAMDKMVRIKTDTFEQTQDIANAISKEFGIKHRKHADGDDYWTNWVDASRSTKSFSNDQFEYEVDLVAPNMPEILNYIQTNFKDSFNKISN